MKNSIGGGGKQHETNKIDLHKSQNQHFLASTYMYYHKSREENLLKEISLY